jgi:hypothetical protein
MLRHLFTLLSALSLLLFVATMVLWVRSYRAGVRLGQLSVSGFWQADVARGVFSLYWNRIVNPNDGSDHFSYSSDEEGAYDLKYETTSPPDGPPRIWTELNGRDRDFQLAGFRYAVHDGVGTAWPSVVRLLTVPCWFVCTVALVLPAARAFSIVRWRRRGRRRAFGLCPSCGYDLRATAGRCPECGTLPAFPAA